ncbi:MULTISPECIES: hypothetical protein [Gracilibacillus]|uniref:hypothetical protein n=1 Tax=Gracilibacillus TaxID=74385 RepID=UPI000824E5ED|nr:MULTISPECIES: hypothetical protein [Gracilibacillus]
MNLFQVRKGQFVFFENELHKVYSVKPMFKKSVHMYRMKDMQQVLTTAKEITFYRPKHNDTFIFYGKRYTIDQYAKPKPGDYILIVKPTPDYLDHYSLNAIEKVEEEENGNVITTRDNGVKHSEYVVMVPGKAEASQEIAYFDKSLVPEEQQLRDESISYLAESDDQSTSTPVVGDIYLDIHKNMRAMIVASTDNEVIFGHGDRVHVSELLDETRYELIHQFDD